ncbi:MAG: glutamyl-tRNA reductase [Acidimicrobiales bacterium]
MSVVVIGLNHRTATLDLLERLTVGDRDLPKALHELAHRPNLSEVAVLSTCNRTEVYAVAERFHGGYHDVREFFAELSGLHPDRFNDHLYVHYDEAAVEHLFKVAAGLDSAVIGEHEILGQVARAWATARKETVAGTALNFLFRHAVEVGKRVRTETAIGRGIASVAQAAVVMAADRLGSLDDTHVLVVGAGGMADGMAVALAGAGVAEVAVANRTRSAAQTLAAKVDGRAITLAALPDELVRTDVLLTSTGATSVVLDHSDVEAAMVQRDGRPLLIVDIAVPRDVDPAAANLDGVTLLDMDDLRAFADAGLAARRRESSRAQRIVGEELARYLSRVTAREAAPLIASLRERAELVRLAEVDRWAGRLDQLDDRQRQAVEALTRGVLAKLLHEPTVRLKDAAGSARGDRLAESLRDLFDL